MRIRHLNLLIQAAMCLTLTHLGCAKPSVQTKVSSSVAAPGFTPSGAVHAQDAGLNDTVTATVTLRSADSGPKDAAILRARLTHLPIDATLTGDGDRLTLELRNVADVESAVSALVSPWEFSVHEAFVWHPRTLPEIQAGPPAPPPGAEMVQHCSLSNHRQQTCEPLNVAPAHIGRGEIVGASFDQFMGSPRIQIHLTATGQQKLADWTAGLVGRYIAIVTDGVTLSVPKIMAPVNSRTVQMNVDSYELIQAHGLVAALSTPPLEGSWTHEAP